MWTFVAAEEKPTLGYFLLSLNCEKKKWGGESYLIPRSN